MKINKVILIGLLINVLFCILPIYDVSNIGIWTMLGLSFSRNIPPFFHTLNPEGFFTLILFVPAEITYETTASIYLTALVFKMIILAFFLLLMLVVNDMLNRMNLSERSRIIIVYALLLNPMVIFINFIWAEIEIIPVFFVTLSLYVLRFNPFNRREINISLSVLSLFIAIFYFLYPVIFLPSLILFTKGRRDRIIILVTSLLVGGLFLYLNVHMFTGYLYNYEGSLSGSIASLSPSALPTGLFYYFKVFGGTRTIIELILIALVSIPLPIVFKRYGLSEFQVLYVIAALFIFISPVINMDNFMFIVPFVFLAFVNESGHMISRKNRLALISITLVPLIFAQFVYSVNNVFGFYYWFYPLLHINGPVFTFTQEENIIFPGYNFFFMLALYVSITAVLVQSKYHGEGWKDDSSNPAGNPTPSGNCNTKKIAVLIIIIVFISASIPLSIVYNDNNNYVNLYDPPQFPLLYFYPEQIPNSSFYRPMGSEAYSISGHALVVPSSDTSLLLNRNIRNQSIVLGGTMFITNPEAPAFLIYTNEWSLQQQALLNGSLIRDYGYTTKNGVLVSEGYIPPLDNPGTLYYFNGNASMVYNINSSQFFKNNYLWFFSAEGIAKVQSLPLQIRCGDYIMEVAMYQSYEVIATLDTATQGGWSQTNPIPYLRGSSNWQTLILSYNAGMLSIDLGGVSDSIPLSPSVSNITLTVGNPVNNTNYSFTGYSSSLYYFAKDTNPISEYLVLVEGNSNSIVGSVGRNIQVAFYFVNSPDGSSVKIDNKIFSVPYSKYLYIVKQGTGTMYLEINRLVIKNEDNRGYYLVPAFLAFYLPLLFGFTMSFFVYCRRKFPGRQ